MKKNRLRLLVLTTALAATAALSAVRPAAACNPYMCFEVDAYTTCCWEGNCELWCG